MLSFFSKERRFETSTQPSREWRRMRRHRHFSVKDCSQELKTLSWVFSFNYFSRSFSWKPFKGVFVLLLFLFFRIPKALKGLKLVLDPKSWGVCRPTTLMLWWRVMWRRSCAARSRRTPSDFDLERKTGLTSLFKYNIYNVWKYFNLLLLLSFFLF